MKQQGTITVRATAASYYSSGNEIDQRSSTEPLTLTAPQLQQATGSTLSLSLQLLLWADVGPAALLPLCRCVGARCCHTAMSSLSSLLHTCGVESSTPTSSPWPMLSVSDALSIVLSQCHPLAAESVSVWGAGSVCSAAAGLVLSADVVSSAPFPPFRASTMDGYAVHSSDGAGVYRVTQRIAAGSAADTPLPVGQVAYITTGAPLPPQADAVIMVERTEAATDGAVGTQAAQPHASSTTRHGAGAR